MTKIFRNKYQEDYFKLPWYERDLMIYTDDLKFKECVQNPDKYFKKVEVTTFDLINHECKR